METITNIISHSLNIQNYFGINKVGFIDIETTGLNRNSNMIYLIGVLFFDSNAGTWTLNQYFANSIDEEQTLLEEFINNICDFDRIITFNGESFDLPFIECRLKKYGIDYIFDKTKSFDLYQIVKKNKYYLNLPNLKLKTIELSLGFNREDKYSGYDCIGFYYNYIKSKNISLKENILKHNYDDLAHMLDIIKILDILEDKKSFYINLHNKSIKFTIENMGIKGDMLNISGFLNHPLIKNIKHYNEIYNVSTKNLNEFDIYIEVKRGYITKEEQCIYIDTSEFDKLNNLNDTLDCKLPSNIFILIIEKKYCINNIKNLLIEIFKDIFK
ncbi:ribonuclease H-like domain-containing protein [Tissierella sp.]|uniref:ribonuclease H-like domain-containing protein n=1 Tax=Tissierella sp. TaxID=41274 RepID=UPI0028A7D36A|nr:ribonuclease H-like domain-containing protein [Tissierella sp.]